MVQRQTLLFFFMALAVSIAGFSQTQSQSPAATSKPVPDARSELAAKLLNVKRIYVESFGDDEESKSLQAMVINALDESKRFIVTENRQGRRHPKGPIGREDLAGSACDGGSDRGSQWRSPFGASHGDPRLKAFDADDP